MVLLLFNLIELSRHLIESLPGGTAILHTSIIEPLQLNTWESYRSEQKMMCEKLRPRQISELSRFLFLLVGAVSSIHVQSTYFYCKLP